MKKAPLTQEQIDSSTLKRASEAERLSVPLKYALSLSRALSGEASPRQAIKAKCSECVGYEDTENRIRTCTVKKCALLAYRPYK